MIDIDRLNRSRWIEFAVYLAFSLGIAYAAEELFFVLIWKNGFSIFWTAIGVLSLSTVVLKRKWPMLDHLHLVLLAIIVFVTLLSALLRLIWLPGPTLVTNSQAWMPLVGFAVGVLLIFKEHNFLLKDSLRIVSVVSINSVVMCFLIQTYLGGPVG